MSTANIDAANLKAITYGGLIREDVMDKIFDISRIPLPFTDMIGSTTSTNDYKEWTTDSLASPDTTNAAIDGDAAGNAVTASGARVGNHHQISEKVVKVSHRADASNTIGKAKQLGYELMRRQQELRRDVEAIALLNQASLASTSTVAGKVGGLPSWLETTHTNGTAGGFNTSDGLTDIRTVGARQTLTEANIRDAVESIYNEGGDPSVLMSTPAVIRKISEYLFTSSARVATLTSDQGKSGAAATALGSVNVFVTDFGTLKLIPNRLQQTYEDSGTNTAADVFILDPAYLQLSYLQGYRTDELAKTGTANNRHMTVDWTLVVNSEKAHGIIGTVNPTASVTA